MLCSFNSIRNCRVISNRMSPVGFGLGNSRCGSVRFFGYNVLFLGTDEVSLETLKVLHADMTAADSSVVDSLQVVCPPDRPQGRGKKLLPVPVKVFAENNGLTVHHTPVNSRTLKHWRIPSDQTFDIAVVVSFGYFIQPHMLEKLRLGAINMHPSLLPKYRGPAPIHHALLNGDAQTGVSIIEIDPKAFDSGRILHQEPMQINSNIQYGDLSKKLAMRGAECVLHTLQNLDLKRKLSMIQDPSIVSKAPKIKKKARNVSWRESAEELFNKWRCIGESMGVKTTWDAGKGQVLEVDLVEMSRLSTADKEKLSKINCALLSKDVTEMAGGEFYFDKSSKCLFVKCGDKHEDWVVITKLKVEGKKTWTAIDFCNGFKIKPFQVHYFQPKLSPN